MAWQVSALPAHPWQHWCYIPVLITCYQYRSRGFLMGTKTTSKWRKPQLQVLYSWQTGAPFFSVTPLMPYSIFSIKEKIIRTMKQLFLPPKQLRVCKGLLEIQCLHETCSNLLWKRNNYFYQRHKLFKTTWITTKSLYSSVLWSAKSPRRHTHRIIYHFHAKHWKIDAREENRNSVINNHCEGNGRRK